MVRSWTRRRFVPEQPAGEVSADSDSDSGSGSGSGSSSSSRRLLGGCRCGCV